MGSRSMSETDLLTVLVSETLIYLFIYFSFVILQVHFEKHACNFSSLYGLNAGYIKYGCLLYLIIAEEYCLMSLNITIFFLLLEGRTLKE